MHERIDQIESSINSRIDSLRNDLACHKQADKGKLRINLAEVVEKYKWLILGVAVTMRIFLRQVRYVYPTNACNIISFVLLLHYVVSN